MYWRPGQRIHDHVPETPSHTTPADAGLESTSVIDILQTMQSSIDGQFTEINSTLSAISTRLDALEQKQVSFESHNAVTTPQSSSSESGKRKRRTPVALQVTHAMCQWHYPSCIFHIPFRTRFIWYTILWIMISN